MNQTEITPKFEIEVIQKLAEKLVWISPVGNDVEYGKGIRGFMVCHRSINNVDGMSTRVDYLMLNGHWKKPFAEDRSLFPTLDDALQAACKAVGLI